MSTSSKAALVLLAATLSPLSGCLSYATWTHTQHEGFSVATGALFGTFDVSGAALALIPDAAPAGLQSLGGRITFGIGTTVLVDALVALAVFLQAESTTSHNAE